ncbi:hypothetical protein CHARACLAT_018438 [Characodon lateralis]|uniref:Uncharacterized protein n=1 Tax=Characodon lateralis TaxID=208331 RepID=A0ABU7D803_9TELE|nr:hypothetical protein [Characodon lateralis]
MLAKQVLLCIDNPFLVRNMREFSAETRQIFPWAKAASLPSEFMTSRKTLHSKGLGETFSPSGKRRQLQPTNLCRTVTPHSHNVWLNLQLRTSIRVFAWQLPHLCQSSKSW